MKFLSFYYSFIQRSTWVSTFDKEFLSRFLNRNFNYCSSERLSTTCRDSTSEL